MPSQPSPAPKDEEVAELQKLIVDHSLARGSLAQALRNLVAASAYPESDFFAACVHAARETLLYEKSAFSHYFVAALSPGPPGDTCRMCGLDLRNEVHLRSADFTS